MHDKIILSLKSKISKILTEMTEVVKEKNYYEISLPMLLDNSYQVSLFLQEIHENEYILYNNLYIPLEMSLKEILKDKKFEKFGDTFLKNPEEFKEIKEILKQFGIDSDKITLDYEIKNIENIHEEVLEYGEFIKKYYNTVYANLLERFAKKTEKKEIYYESFEKVLKTYSGRSKFSELKYNGLSKSPIYENNENLVATTRNLNSLTKFYVDLEDLLANKNYQKGILVYKALHKTDNLKNLELKFSKKRFKIVFIKENTEDEIKKIIDTEFFDEEI